MAYAIDTLQVVKKLTQANFTAEQAEAIANVIVSDEGGLATKEDITAVKRDIASVEHVLKQDIKLVEQEIIQLRREFKQDMTMLEQRITIKIGGLLIAVVGGVELIKAFITH